MKNISLLTWITQLGLSVALPPIGFILLCAWLRSSMGWGVWVVWLGVILGIYCAIQGLVASLRGLERLSKQNDPKHKPVSYNDHC